MRNQSGSVLVRQTLRVARPAVHLSGRYTCKVSTFYLEQRSDLQLIIFGTVVSVEG